MIGRLRVEEGKTWTWLVAEPESEQELLAITGKYLFFSKDREKLIELAKTELTEHGFRLAKVPRTGHEVRGVYVLCLYYKDDTRQHELASRHPTTSEVWYRYWKSDRNTLDGRYSKQFLADLTESRSKIEDVV